MDLNLTDTETNALATDGETSLDWLDEIQQLPWKRSVGRVLSPEPFKLCSWKCRSMRSSHGAILEPVDTNGGHAGV